MKTAVAKPIRMKPGIEYRKIWDHCLLKIQSLTRPAIAISHLVGSKLICILGEPEKAGLVLTCRPFEVGNHCQEYYSRR